MGLINKMADFMKILLIFSGFYNTTTFFQGCPLTSSNGLVIRYFNGRCIHIGLDGDSEIDADTNYDSCVAEFGEYASGLRIDSQADEDAFLEFLARY